MSRVSKIFKCVDCKREFPRKGLNRKFRCPDCAMRKMTAVARQIENKSGPEYENWKQTCLRKAERYAEGIKGG